MPLHSLKDAASGKAGQPLRFAMTGAVNTVLGLVIYPALLWAFPWLRIHYLVALGISQVLCVLFAFASYKLNVFKSRGNVLAEFFRFVSFYAVNYLINWIALPLLVEFGHVPPAAAQVGLTLVVVVGSYFWHSRVTFRDLEK